MFKNNWKKEIFTIPNVLSMIRLALIPVYVIIYLNANGDPTKYYLSAAILAVSCLTDMIDGKIARHFNMISTFGKFLDPLADKLTQFTLIVCLSIKHPVLWYLVALFFIKESFQLIAGSITFRKGKMLVGALLTGKICTTVLFVSLIVLVMMPNIEEKIVTIIAIIDAIFMCIAFADYFLSYYGKNEERRNKRIQDVQNPFKK